MKIAVFTDSYLPGTGGTENAVKNMCKGLENIGHEVKIYCPDYHVKGKTVEEKVFRVTSIKLSTNDMAVLPLLQKRKLTESVKNFNPDIIHFCTGSGMAKWALKIGKKLNIPVVGTIHTKFRMAFSDTIKSKLVVNCMVKSIANKLDRCQAVSVVSNSQIPDIHSYGYKKENIQVIKNGSTKREKITVLPQTQNLVKEKYKLTGKTVFLFVGRVVKFKNIQFSIKALSELKKRNDDNLQFKFLIVGEGPYQKQLEKLIRKHNLEENVIFTGVIKDREILNAIYMSSDLLLFPSIFDNDTLVVCEAGSNGTPSLVLKDTGPSERIKANYNGFVSEHNEVQFAKEIERIINDKTLYQKVVNNLNTILPKDWDGIAKEYQKFYEDAIKTYNNTKR